MKRVVRSASFLVLGLAFLAPLAGCQADNEAGISDQKGTADPKYNSDATYEQYAKDQRSKKIGAEPGKASTETKKN
jgi:hypothetical protein